MENSTPDLLVDLEERVEVYATFWQRLFALFIDWVVLFAASVFQRYNNWGGQIPSVFIIISLITLAYKPVLEYLYGATVGKMAVKIKVVNKHFQRPSISNILLRNIFNIGYRLFIMISWFLVFYREDLSDSPFLQDMGTSLSYFNEQGWSNYVLLFICIVEIICLLTDDQKRSLHDRIGETLVVMR